MRTLLNYIGAFIALAIAVFVLAHLGESLREITPVDLHDPLWMAGMGLSAAAMIGLVAFKTPPFSIGHSAWRRSMLAGAAFGALLYAFYISDVECYTTPRAGIACRYTGPGSEAP